MARVQVMPGQGESFQRTLSGESIVIGRSSDADLQVDDKYLSRQHARMDYRDGGWWIEDLGSRNGTKLNGSFVEQPTLLEPGDEIRLCQSTILFDAEEVTHPPPVSETRASDPHTRYFSAAELTRLGAASTMTDDDTVAELQLRTERLHLLNDVHRALGHSLELDELLDLILDRAFDALKPEEALIYLKGNEGSYYRAAQRSAGDVDAEHLYSETLLREVAEKGMAALVTDTGADMTFGPAESILGHGVLSLVAAPLLDAEGSQGMIALTSRLTKAHFDDDDLELLVSLASIAAMRIRNVALAEQAAAEAAARGRLEEEVHLARQIQVALLPSRLPEIEGYELFGGNEPSRGVSGDYYTVVDPHDGDHFVAMVADVSGKGIAASLLTFSLEALAAGPIDNGQPPNEVCRRVCRMLYKRTPPAKYATLFLAALDPDANVLTYANAGHNPGLLVASDGQVRQLASTGPPVGLVRQGDYSAKSIHLDPGALLVLYTDGITEASDPDDEEYGVDRLATICKRRRQDDLEFLAAAIERDLDGFTRGVPYADDRTLLLIRRT